jgi:hypothetical protein
MASIGKAILFLAGALSNTAAAQECAMPAGMTPQAAFREFDATMHRLYQERKIGMRRTGQQNFIYNALISVDGNRYVVNHISESLPPQRFTTITPENRSLTEYFARDGTGNVSASITVTAQAFAIAEQRPELRSLITQPLDDTTARLFHRILVAQHAKGPFVWTEVTGETTRRYNLITGEVTAGRDGANIQNCYSSLLYKIAKGAK